MTDARLPSRRPRRGIVRLALLVVVPAIALACAAAYFLLQGRYVGTDDAYVRADSVRISPEVSGRVVAVAVADNQHVAKGDVLFRLDDRPFQFALEQADANLRNVGNALAAMLEVYRQKQEELKLDETNAAYFKREYERQSALNAHKFASESALDSARHDLDNAEQSLAALRREIAGILAGLDGNATLPPDQRALYLAAKAKRDQAALDLEHAVVRAPADGVVTDVSKLQPGDFLEAGTPAFMLVRTDSPWIEANLKETDLTHVTAGEPATVEIDTYPGRVWAAHVASISPATGAAFSLLPAQNTTGNWVKVVQRVPVRLALESDAGAPPLRAGMSATAEIDTGRAPSLPRFVRAMLAWAGIRP